MLDSADCNVVAELVGALKKYDRLAIHEGDHNHEDAKRHPHSAAMILVCVLADVQLKLLLCFAHF